MVIWNSEPSVPMSRLLGLFVAFFVNLFRSYDYQGGWIDSTDYILAKRREHVRNKEKFDACGKARKNACKD